MGPVEKLPRDVADDFFFSLDAREECELLLIMPEGERRIWMRLLAPHDAADLVQLAWDPCIPGGPRPMGALLKTSFLWRIALVRNEQRLEECFPAFAGRVASVISDLEGQGLRPRIQDAHRTIEDQLKAFKGGFSRVKFGFHNVTATDGTPESLAVDLLDDSHPLNPPREYLIRLAAAGRAQGLQTGIFFGLPSVLRRGLEDAVTNLDFNPAVKIGFDPTHLEVADTSIAEAKAGKRPR